MLHGLANAVNVFSIFFFFYRFYFFGIFLEPFVALSQFDNEIIGWRQKGLFYDCYVQI